MAISGATSKTYTLAAAEQGKRISVRVTFTDDGGTVETSTSSQTAAASGGSLPEGAPDITGRSRVGDTLTAITGRISDADGMEQSTFTYQWRAGGVAISGAASRTYTLVAAQQGKRISVRVTFEDDGGTTETLTSPATGTVLAAGTANQNPTGLPTISGTVKAGQTLTTNTGGIADAGRSHPSAIRVPVAGGRRGDFGADGQGVHGGVIGSGQAPQGTGELHGRRRYRRDADERGDSCGSRCRSQRRRRSAAQ